MRKRLTILASAAFLFGVVAPALAASEPVVMFAAATSTTINVSKTYTAAYSDPNGVSSCLLYVDGSSSGQMNLSGNSTAGTASISHTFATSGTFGVYAQCTDSNRNVGLSNVINVIVSSSVDTSAPSMPSGLTHTSASSDNTASFTWGASSDNIGVTAYEVSVNGGPYNTVGSAYTTELSALGNGSHTFTVRAKDAAGNVSSVNQLYFTISAGSTGSQVVTFTLEQMRTDANALVGSARASLESTTGRTCELSVLAAASRVASGVSVISDASARATIENFTGCGTTTSLSLGSGERLGVVNSYRAAFGRWPTTSDHWYDVMKIAQGRFPSEISASAEADAKIRFRAVYLREAIMSVAADANAVTVMAYGLRPLPRNLNSEIAATASFRAVYGRAPSSARDWDTVRAVAYSGATR